MTIRYECEQCGSTLKIKDDLAGKPGKCPKCKTAFTVPAASESLTDSDGLSDSEPEITAPKAVARKPVTASNDDFDVDAFLMSESRSETGTKSKPKSKGAAADFNEDDFLSDEPAGKRSGKSSKSASQDSEDDDEVFQIRRSDGGDGKSKKPSSDIEDEPERPAVSGRRPPGTSSAGTAANIASDLLAKTGKKGKKAWNVVEPESKESEYDYTDLKNYLLKKVAPLLVGGIIGIYLLSLVMSSMMSGKSGLPALGQVTGTVTLSGKPVPSVLVWFHPIQSVADRGDKKKRVSSSSGMTDESGHYELSYLANVKGVVVGECRIQIEAPSRSDVPAQWLGAKSTVTKQVESGRKVIDLDISK